MSQYRQVEITPELASELLRGSRTPQRDRSNSQIEHLADQIKDGMWITDGSQISLDSKKNVLQGQHCLAAIIKANIPVTAWVLFDADPEAKLAYDTHRARSAQDLLDIHGIKLKIRKAGQVVKAFHTGSTGRFAKLPTYVLQKIASQLSPADLFVSDAMSEHVPKVTDNASLLAVICRAYFARPAERDMLRTFCRILVTGQYDGRKPYEKNAFILREWLRVPSLQPGRAKGARDT